MTLADFFAGAKTRTLSPRGRCRRPGRCSWRLMREVVRKASQRAPRPQQVHLGPSEIGSECDREVAGKLAGLEATNHVTDPWPSVVGTAVHAWMEEAFTADGPRWLTERKVTPAPDAPARENGHTGTADLFDLRTATLIDHKILGRSTHDKLVRHGPPAHYRARLLLFARGYQLAGVPVRRVALAAWPRAGATLGGLHVWGLELNADTDSEVDQLLTRHHAPALRSGRRPASRGATLQHPRHALLVLFLLQVLPPLRVRHRDHLRRPVPTLVA